MRDILALFGLLKILTISQITMSLFFKHIWIKENNLLRRSLNLH